MSRPRIQAMRLAARALRAMRLAARALQAMRLAARALLVVLGASVHAQGRALQRALRRGVLPFAWALLLATSAAEAESLAPPRAVPPRPAVGAAEGGEAQEDEPQARVSPAEGGEAQEDEPQARVSPAEGGEAQEDEPQAQASSAQGGEAQKDEPQAQASSVQGGEAQDHELQKQVDQAVAAFQGGQYEVALGAFDAVIRATTEPSELALLQHNAGLCAFELGRYADAERRFLVAAKLAADRADQSLLFAGFAALRGGHPARAARILARVTPKSGSERRLSRQLADELAAANEDARRSHLRGAVESGYRLLGAGRTGPARRSFRRSLTRARASDAELRARIHYGLARTAELEGNLELALGELDLAASASPRSPEIFWLRAAVHAELGNRSSALADYRRSRKLSASEEDRAELQRRIEAIELISPSGLDGFAWFGLGYDSNASQSGSADSLGLTGRSGSSSSTSRSSGSLALVLEGKLEQNWRISPRWQLTPSLSLDVVEFARKAVREVSLQGAEVASALGYASTPDVLLTLAVGASHDRNDWFPGSAFTTASFVEFGTLFAHGAAWQTSATLRFSRWVGHDENAALTGPQLSAAWGARWASRRSALRFGVAATWYDAGVAILPADPNLLPRCQEPGPERMEFCDRLQLSAPLGYFAPQLQVGGSSLVWGRLRFDGSVGTKYSYYLSEGSLNAGAQTEPFPGSEKRRQDWTFDLGAGLSHPLYPWTARPEPIFKLELGVRHLTRFNSSNLSPDSSSAEHRFDYEERNYRQHIPEVGLRLSW